MAAGDIERRELLVAATAVFSAACMPVMAHAATLQDYVLAQTASGTLRGARAGKICIFKGIAYGGDVAGAMRFRPPPPPPRWSGVRDALSFGARSWQLPDNGLGSETEPYTSSLDENCLFLNVWTPALDGKKRPVMFYNHGGGFFAGSGEKAEQSGAYLASEYDVVVVESNHRLGLLGYLFLTDILGPDYPGNQGLQDIAAALRWVHINIANFGGDPANVMIFGESGGGGKTAALYTMPSARDYFNKASIESGPNWRFPPREDGTETTRTVLEKLGIPVDQARRLLDVPVAQLMAVQKEIGNTGGPILIGGPSTAPHTLAGFQPVIDGTILPANPFSPMAPSISADKPLMIGLTTDERVFQHLTEPATFSIDDAELHRRMDELLGANGAPAIALYQRLHPGRSPSWLLLRIERDAFTWSSVVLIAERKYQQHAAPVFVYELAYASPTLVPGTNYPIGSPHSADISLKFNTIPAPGPHLFAQDQSAGRHMTARMMSELWATFARTGHPAAKGAPAWPNYTPGDRAEMVINASCHIVVDPDEEARLFWQNLRPAMA